MTAAVLARIRNEPEPVEITHDEWAQLANTLGGARVRISWEKKGKHGSIDTALYVDGRRVVIEGWPWCRPHPTTVRLKTVGGPCKTLKVVAEMDGSYSTIPFPTGTYEWNGERYAWRAHE